MKTLLYIYGAMMGGMLSSSSDIASRETETVYKGHIYTPFFLCAPSDRTAQERGIGACSPSYSPHRATVLFDEEGWTSGTETLRSTYTNPNSTPIGDALSMLWMAVLWGLWRRRKRRNIVCGMIAIMSLCACPMYAGIDAIDYTQRSSTITVRPTLSGISEPATYLQWAVYNDAECSAEISDITLTDAPESSCNAIAIEGLEKGTYYLQLRLRTGNACEGAITDSRTQEITIYPDEADVVLRRRNQMGGEQVGLRDELPDAIQAYGVMEFDKSTLHNVSLSAYERYNYFFSLPFDVRLGDVTGFGVYGRHWMISYYDGIGRATNGYWADSESNWKRIGDTDSVLHKGQGYLLQLNSLRMAADQDVWAEGVSTVALYFPAQNTTSSIVLSNETIPALSDSYRCTIDYSEQLGEEGNRTIKDSYWRCVGVPGWMETPKPGLMYFYEWDKSDNSLAVASADRYDFESMHAYLVQYSDAIVWTEEGGGAIARRRTTREGDSELLIRLSQSDNEIDHTYIRLCESGSSTGYDFNADLVKQMNSSKPQVYTLVGQERVAANCMPMEDSTMVVPLGIQCSFEDDYTLGLADEAAGMEVILIDEQTNTRTNLGLMNYTAHIEAGTNDRRFALAITPGAIATDIEEPTNVTSKSGVRKTMLNGMLYIIVEDRVYDSRGIRIGSEL